MKKEGDALNLNRHGGFFDRVRRTFDFRRSPADVRPDTRRISPVLKLNLAPLMGRRDAAVDQAASLIGSDLFTLNDSMRLAAYDKIVRLLELALDDCSAIISGLSSQDTIKRETLQRAFISMIHATVVTIRDLAALEDLFLTDNQDTVREFAGTLSAAQQAENEKVFTGTEINLVNRLRGFFDITRPRLARYREYAARSFSPVYAEKYSLAYKSYLDVYGRKDF